MTLPALSSIHHHLQQRSLHTYTARRSALEALRAALYTHEEAIYAALHADLKKNPEEAWVTEIGFTLAEISFALKNLKRWMRPQRVPTNLLNWPSRSWIQREPLGAVLIVGPWNYPLQLLLSPLVGALAGGNAAVLKPSEAAPHTAAVLEKIIATAFPAGEVVVMQGNGAEVVPALMEAHRFDHIFYTGSTGVGQEIYEMAARTLTPVTLELGGKSPCIVCADADLEVAAKRIALTKFSNAGQMCVAPDYLLIESSVYEPFLEKLKTQIHRFYLADDYHYGKLINQRAFDRLKTYMGQGRVLFGGEADEAALRISPTVMEIENSDAAILNEEIFGPLLPVLRWNDDADVYRTVARHANPLAMYVFSSNTSRAQAFIDRIPAGGACINNAVLHLTNPNLPFGGRGASGTGAYHGKWSFDTFTHPKAVMRTPTWWDPAVKYPPFKGKLGLLKKLIR